MLYGSYTAAVVASDLGVLRDVPAESGNRRHVQRAGAALGQPREQAHASATHAAILRDTHCNYLSIRLSVVVLI